MVNCVSLVMMIVLGSFSFVEHNGLPLNHSPPTLSQSYSNTHATRLEVGLNKYYYLITRLLILFARVSVRGVTLVDDGYIQPSKSYLDTSISLQHRSNLK